MADLTTKLVTVLTIVLFIFGTGITMYGIFKSNELSQKQLDESTIIPSQVLNGLTVMFLLYLTATNTSFSATYKLLIIFLLVGGMIIEIYLTSYADRKAESIAAYIFVTLNFLIRAFFLIDLAQSDAWVSPVKPFHQAVKANVMKPLEEAIKEVAQPVTEIISNPVEEKPSTDQVSDYKDKFRAIVKDMKSKNPNFDNMTIVRDAWPVIDNAAKKGEFTKEHLKEALDKIKNKDGTDISGVSVGGRKRS